MNSGPMTENQGDEIIRLLKKIAERLEEISVDTADVSTIAASLKQVEKNVFDLWLKS